METQFAKMVKRALNRRGSRIVLAGLLNVWARTMPGDLKRGFYDQEDWIHETPHGFFVYPEPLFRLDMERMEQQARFQFLWGYTPRRGEVVVDIGAGVGEETLLFSKEVGDRGQVICVEAHPQTFRRLQKFIKYNNLGNVTAIHCAVVDSTCKNVTIEDSVRYLNNRVFGSNGIPVKATTVDAIHEQLDLGRINFLKMNIEGSEKIALKGMARTVKQTEVICISCHDFRAQASGDDFFRSKDEVRSFLDQNGLRVAERTEEKILPAIRDQIWGYNDALINEKASLHERTLIAQRAEELKSK